MVTAHLSAREAKALGLQAPPRHGREPYHTRCETASCGAVFTTQAAETRHMTETGHRRYALVLEARSRDFAVGH